MKREGLNMNALNKFLAKLSGESGKLAALEGAPAQLGYLAKRAGDAGKAGIDTVQKAKMSALLGAGGGASGLAAYQGLTDDEDEELLKRLLAERGM
jgi:hypothetical protein